MKLPRARALFVLAVAPCALLAACSLTTSLDGLSGGAVDGGPSAQTDATSDGSTPGDGASGEAASEGGPSPDAAPAIPYCDSLGFKPAFCDDFEHSDPKGPWDNTALNGGGTLAISASTRAPSGGRELVASIPIFPAGSVSVANVVRTLGQAQRVTLSYALRIEAPPTQSQQQVMMIGVAPADAPSDFFHTYLLVTTSGVVVTEETFPGGVGANGTVAKRPLSRPITFGTWQRIEMTVKLSAPPRVTVTVDGTLALDDVPDAFYRPGSANIVAGVHYSDSPSGPLAVHVDDLYGTIVQ